jgi:hypothetical protein
VIQTKPGPGLATITSVYGGAGGGAPETITTPGTATATPTAGSLTDTLQAAGNRAAREAARTKFNKFVFIRISTDLAG